MYNRMWARGYRAELSVPGHVDVAPRGRDSPRLLRAPRLGLAGRAELAHEALEADGVADAEERAVRDQLPELRPRRRHVGHADVDGGHPAAVPDQHLAYTLRLACAQSRLRDGAGAVRAGRARAEQAHVELVAAVARLVEVDHGAGHARRGIERGHPDRRALREAERGGREGAGRVDVPGDGALVATTAGRAVGLPRCGDGGLLEQDHPRAAEERRVEAPGLDLAVALLRACERAGLKAGASRRARGAGRAP
jgi:hypothetical protein